MVASALCPNNFDKSRKKWYLLSTKIAYDLEGSR